MCIAFRFFFPYLFLLLAKVLLQAFVVYLSLRWLVHADTAAVDFHRFMGRDHSREYRTASYLYTFLNLFARWCCRCTSYTDAACISCMWRPHKPTTILYNIFLWVAFRISFRFFFEYLHRTHEIIIIIMWMNMLVMFFTDFVNIAGVFSTYIYIFYSPLFLRSEHFRQSVRSIFHILLVYACEMRIL